MTAPTLKAHGLDGSLVEPDWAPLTLAELRPLIACFPQLGEPMETVFASPRPLSAAGRGAHSGAAGLRQTAYAFCARPRRPARRASLPAAPRGTRRVCAACAAERVGRNRDAKPASGPTKCMSLPPEPTCTATRSRGRHSNAPPMRTRPARLWPGCILPRRASMRRGGNLSRWSPASRSSCGEDPQAALEHYLARSAVISGSRRCAAMRNRSPASARAVSSRIATVAQAHPSALDAQRSARLESVLERCRRTTPRATAIIDFGLADRTNAVHDLAHAIERNIVEWLASFKIPRILTMCRSTSIILKRCSRDTNPCARFRRRNPRPWRP